MMERYGLPSPYSQPHIYVAVHPQIHRQQVPLLALLYCANPKESLPPVVFRYIMPTYATIDSHDAPCRMNDDGSIILDLGQHMIPVQRMRDDKRQW